MGQSILNKILFALFFIFLSTYCFAVETITGEISTVKKNESYYQEQWCTGKGEIEVILSDRTRVDCLTYAHAIEVDFASKFYQAIGQSLYYAMHTGKRAGVLLIIKSGSDEKYWNRLNATIEFHKLPIDTYRIEAEIE